MKAILITPPWSDPTQPMLGPAALAGFMKAFPNHHVELYDAGLMAFEYLTDPERLAESARLARERLVRLDTEATLDFYQMGRYRRLAKALLAAEYLIGHVSAAKETLRSERFYDIRAYRWAMNTLNRALELASAPYLPTRLSLTDLHMRYSWQSSAQLAAGVLDENENPLIEFAREVAVPYIRAQRPDLIGLSLAHTPQLVGALTLVKEIRAALPDVTVVFGGPLIPYLLDSLNGSQILEGVDGVVSGQGEDALLAILDALESGRDLTGAPNLRLRLADGTLAPATNAASRPVSSLPTPSYEGLPLHSYLVPTPVLSVMANRNCYWAQCTFCSRFGDYEPRAEAKVVQDMAHLATVHGAGHFVFAGDLLAPVAARNISRLIREHNLQVAWYTDIRAEPTFDAQLFREMAAAGATELRFGLESACQRVLDLIQKGTDMSVVVRHLSQMRAAGIACRVSLFVGYPGETREEALQTMQFMLENRDVIARYDLTFFGLEKGSHIWREPARYGITRVYESNERDLDLYYRYDVASGQSMTEVMESFCQIQKELVQVYAPQVGWIPFKSHSLLLHRRHGPQITVPAEQQPVLRESLRRAPGAVPMLLKYDLLAIEEQIFRHDVEINDLLLEQGLSVAQITERINAENPPITPRPGYYVYAGDRDRTYRLTAAMAELIRRADGRPVADLLPSMAPSDRGRVVADLSSRGLLQTGGEE